ncbi:MAG: diguanylate cyclase [Ketobacteraceae bacterium]|nr:diguanylate cyclase [Ketobacteraceae bacterium]
MNLNNKITLLLVAVYVLLLTILTAERVFFDIPELKSLQRQSDFNEMERVVRALEYQKVEVSRLAYDYGVWDDTWEYVNTRDPEYIASNFISDTFESLLLNAVLIFDRQGEVIWSGGHMATPEEDQEFPVSRLFPDGFDLAQLALELPDEKRREAVVRKEYLIGEEYLLIAARVSIMPTEPEGVPRGTLVMLRAVTPDIVDLLSETTQQSFSLYLMESVGNDKTLAALAPQIDKLGDEEIYRDNGHGYRWLRGEDGNPVALIRVSLSDAIYDNDLLDSVTVVVFIVATITMLLLRVVLQRLVLNPLSDMRGHLRRIRETANYSLRLENNRGDEIGDLSRECDSLVDYVKVQEDYLRAINQDLTKKAMEDGLTEVANRRHFDVKFELLYRAFAQKQQPIFVVLVDVDFFKAYNDNYGHLKGDEALKHVADELLKNVRLNTDMVARYGGEEFAILLTETDVTGVKIVCDKLLEAIRRLNIPHEYSRAAPRLTVSMGVAGWVPKDEDSKAMIDAADKALYEAKEAGRDCVQYHIVDDSITR